MQIKVTKNPHPLKNNYYVRALNVGKWLNDSV
jgi:hypothetical protein